MMFIYDFTPIAAERIVTKVLGLVISLWAITSILVVAFQCRSSKVWDSVAGECFSQCHCGCILSAILFEQKGTGSHF
ncbi:hypothetical protein BPAE_0026g00270 [Botrytis paeoniae]|uniref:Uncharacterized protein n=1 Tax=Botrytis paeoniae TaxID=278948 RepID=A0A4Z1G385_9HELO|nr:hypothetical protein BPAE_0026g00270 [Botrytis paeoniae]